MDRDTSEILRQEILDYYKATAKGNGGWRRIGRILGTSGGAAAEIAYGHREPTLKHITAWVNSDHSHLTVALSCPSCLREKGQAITHAHDLDCHGDPDAVAVMVKPDAQQAIALIDQWLADGSGHDEAVWPVIEKALRRRGQQADPTRKRPPAYRPMLPAAWRLEIERRGLDIRQIVAEALQINESDYHGWTPTTSTEPVAFSRPKNYGPNALAEFENDGGEVEIRAIETDAALDQFLDIVEERNVAICRSMTTALQGYEVI